MSSSRILQNAGVLIVCESKRWFSLAVVHTLDYLTGEQQVVCHANRITAAQLAVRCVCSATSVVTFLNTKRWMFYDQVQFQLLSVWGVTFHNVDFNVKSVWASLQAFSRKRFSLNNRSNVLTWYYDSRRTRNMRNVYKILFVKREGKRYNCKVVPVL